MMHNTMKALIVITTVLRSTVLSSSSVRTFMLVHCHQETKSEQEFSDCQTCFDNIANLEAPKDMSAAKECIQTFFDTSKVNAYHLDY